MTTIWDKEVDVDDVESKVDEEIKFQETRDQKRKATELIVDRHPKQKLLTSNSGDLVEESPKLPHKSKGVFIYAMDTEEDPIPLIVSFEGIVPFEIAYEKVCGLMKCATGCVFQQGTRLSMDNKQFLPPGNYEFMTFPRRGDGFSISRSVRVDDKLQFLSCKAWLVNDRRDPLIRILVDLVVDSVCHLELIIPKRKVRQLQLEEEKETVIFGWGNHSTRMMLYRYLQVCILHEFGNTVYTRVDLTPACRLEEIDNDPLLESLARVPSGVDMDLCVDADFNKVTPHQNPSYPSLKLTVTEYSPLERNPGEPNVLLGLRGLQKLGLTIDFEKQILLPVVSPVYVSHAI